MTSSVLDLGPVASGAETARGFGHFAWALWRAEDYGRLTAHCETRAERHATVLGATPQIRRPDGRVYGEPLFRRAGEHVRIVQHVWPEED